MTTIHLKGAGLNDYFAEKIVENDGAQHALDHSCGPMLKAVERVIVAKKLDLSSFTYDRNK